jgi:hypothetical protein
MTFKSALCASTVAAGIGLAGVLGVGLATASADPGCNAPGKPACGQDQHNNGPGPNQGSGGPGGPNQGPGGPGPAGWHNRGVDQGRQDHQPFNWNGQEVTPMPAGNGAGWGFWFGGVWIPL